MDKIIIKNTKNADSRTSDDELTSELLWDATIQHQYDVERGMTYLAEKIIEVGKNHDWTKTDNFDTEYAPLVLSAKNIPQEKFVESDWYQKHIHLERHHVNADAKADINLIDCLEHLVDTVMAGKGRSGYLSSKYMDIDPLLLYRAYWNTVKLLDDIVEVSNGEQELLKNEKEKNE